MKILTTIGSIFSSINTALDAFDKYADAFDKYAASLAARAELQRATKEYALNCAKSIPVVTPSLSDEQRKLLQEFRQEFFK